MLHIVDAHFEEGGEVVRSVVGELDDAVDDVQYVFRDVAADEVGLFERTDLGVLQAQLHLLTRFWVVRFSDKRLPYQKIQEAIMAPEDDTPTEDTTRVRMLTGVLYGRPQI